MGFPTGPRSGGWVHIARGPLLTSSTHPAHAQLLPHTPGTRSSDFTAVRSSQLLGEGAPYKHRFPGWPSDTQTLQAKGGVPEQAGTCPQGTPSREATLLGGLFCREPSEPSRLLSSACTRVWSKSSRRLCQNYNIHLSGNSETSLTYSTGEASISFPKQYRKWLFFIPPNS